MKKEKYRRFCETVTDLPLFSMPWWLDATVGESNWDVALCVNNNDEVVASMPYVLTKKYGFTLIGQPNLTPFLGPWVAPLQGTHSKVLSRQKELIQELFAQLPAYDDFRQNWHSSLTNWLPLYWQGFSQTTKYTYTIELDPALEPLALFTSNMRNKVRKAEKIVTVSEEFQLDDFFTLNEKTFQRQGITAPYSFNYVKSFDRELDSRERRKIFFAIDNEKNIHSALYLIWDNNTAYVHMVGEDPEFRSSGAGILLIKHAIDFATDKGLKIFDFEGSMIEGVEIVRRSCGGTQTPYHSLSHTPSKILRISRFLRQINKKNF